MAPQWTRLSAILFLLILCSALPVHTVEKQILFREEFLSIDRWRPLYFPKIKLHATYAVKSDGGEQYLSAESRASASALLYKDEFSVYEYPKAGWRWRVDTLSLKGDPQKKSGDDYPIRVYFMFRYDPEKATFFEKIRYGIAKKLYGEYPPHSTLSYVWSYAETAATMYDSPYTDKAKIIVLRNGKSSLGRWMVEERNILEDYRRVFGKDPPQTAGIALMADSDNTGGETASSVDFIEVSRDVP